MYFKASYRLLGAALCASPVIASETPESIETVTIVSHRMVIPQSDSATSTSVLSQAALDNNYQLNIADVLRNLPGVDVSGSGGPGKITTVRIRGEDGFRTRLYIDGVVISDPSAPQVTPIFDDVLAAQIERVEVLRGPQGLAFGADAGGVVSLFTRTPQAGVSGEVLLESGRYDTNTLAADVSFANDSGSLYFAIKNLETDGFNAQTQDTSGEADGYQNTSVHFKGQYAPSESLSFKLVARESDASNAYDGCFDNQTFAPSNDCLTDTQTRTTHLSADYQQASSAHTVSVSDTEFQRDFFSNKGFGFRSQGNTLNADYVFATEYRESRWVAGVDWRRTELDETQQSRRNRGAFAEWHQSITARLKTHAGVRFDDNDTFGQHLTYRVGVVSPTSLDNGHSINVKASWGTGFRAPSLFEQAYNDGPFAFGEAQGLALTEETSRGMDVAVEYLTSDGISAQLTLFDQRIEDLIEFDNLSFQGYLQLPGTSTSRGIEGELAFEVHQHLDVRVNYTYNDAQTLSGERRARRPRHQLNAGLYTTWLDDRLAVNASVRVNQDSIGIDGEPLDDYSDVRLSARYKVTPRITLMVRIENLLDETYQEARGFNVAGRSAYLGARLSF